MRKLISFMHISLDGFVAGPKGEMDWIKVNPELFEYVGQRISKSDTAMYGRVTWQMMESYWPTAGSKLNASRHDIEHSQWYANVKKVVLSRHLKDETRKDLTVISDHLAENVNQFRQGEGEDILVFGSPGATHSLIQHGLIDGFWLFLNPVILGEGIPLFTGIKDKIKLRLVSPGREFDSGVRELNYLLDRST